MNKRSCFWNPFRCEHVNKSQKLLKLAEKKTDLTHFYIIYRQTELEKAIFSQIWDFTLAC